LIRGVPAAAVAAAAVLLAACSGAAKINSQQVDIKLLNDLHKTRPGVTVSVLCPSGVKIKTGASFTCHVDLAGADTLYTVTVSGLSGSSYDIQAQPTEPIFDTQQVASAVQQQEGAGTTVNCGATRFVQVPVNGTFSCKVDVQGQIDTLTARVTDAQGGVSFSTSTSTGSTTTTAAPATGGTLPGD
jgi:hypothetical protein